MVWYCLKKTKTKFFLGCLFGPFQPPRGVWVGTATPAPTPKIKTGVNLAPDPALVPDFLANTPIRDGAPMRSGSHMTF